MSCSHCEKSHILVVTSLAQSYGGAGTWGFQLWSGAFLSGFFYFLTAHSPVSQRDWEDTLAGMIL